MSLIILYKLLAIFCTVAIGWVAGRLRWLGEPVGGTDPARLLGNAAFYIFVPALLFRSTVRLDLSRMPWTMVLAFFVPVLLLATLVVVWGRRRQRGQRTADLAAGELAAAEPSSRAIAAVFGNSVQVGIPMAAAIFGDTGLGMLVALVSLHSLVLLTALTLMVEVDLGRARAAHEASASLRRTLRNTVRNTVVHPVTLPVLAGLVANLLGLSLPGPVDETLALLGTAVAPLCLVLIGLSLAYTHVAGAVGQALQLSALKLLVLPAMVLALAHWGFGLSGLPLQVVVLMAALPTGSNALIFAQRYRAGEVQATATIVVSTLAFMFSAPMWLALLARLD